MAIVPMKFVSACTDRDHLDEMLMKTRTCGLLHPVSASQIVTEDNGGQLLNEDNPYSGYRQTIRNLAHSIGCEIKENVTPSKAYTKEEIEAFIAEITDKFGINSDSNEVLLTPDDEAALKELSKCGFERIHACRYLNFGFGRLPADSFPKLSMYGQECFVHHRCHATDQYIWMVYVTSDSYAQKVRKIFQDLYFEPIEIPAVDVHRLMEEYRDKINDVYAYCDQEDMICSMYPDVAVLDSKMIVSGFIQADQQQAFREVFAGMPVDFRFKEPSEMPQCKCPTVLKNNWFSRPFELFVEMYSLPQYGDFDPTFFMALTYCLLFGIMFGDMGQGLVLMAIGFAFEKKGKLFGVIGRVGITSTIFGFLFGSCFGFENVTPALWLRPRTSKITLPGIGSINTVLVVAVVFGMFLILTTMILNIINSKRLGDKEGELFGTNSLTGFIFYTGVVIFIICSFTNHKQFLGAAFIIIFFVVPLAVMFLKEPLTAKLTHKEPKEKVGVGMFIVQSFFEMFETLLSFFSNTLSFIRIGAFAVSHAAMMEVVLMLANGGKNIGVVIGGNIFVMGMEGLIVGIQVLRLEYYEMFSRFYRGDGKEFKPFLKQEKNA